MKEPTITLPVSVAAVALDLAEVMSKPMTTEAVVQCVQRAEFLIPELQQAFYREDIDPDAVERAELPPLFRRPS
jgi:hypothetical protein